jgi:hypothetical protein
VTDTGVLFQGGNTALNWSGGVAAIAVNLTALSICLGLRLRSEIKKSYVPENGGAKNLFQKTLVNPNSSMISASAAQLIAAIACANHINKHELSTYVNTAVPALFAAANALATYDFKNIRSKVARISLNADTYFATGLIMASSSYQATAVFSAAAALSTYRSVKNNKTGPDPRYLFALGCGVASYYNPSLAPILMTFGLAYLTLKATQDYSGPFEAVEATPRVLRANWAKMTTPKPL